MVTNKKQVPSPPSPEQVEKHWKAQDKSVFQKPFTRDPGVTIVTTPGEVARIIDAAREGETVPACKLRNTDEILPDPLARTGELLRKSHRGLSKDDFSLLIQGPLDQLTYLALYGHMSDYQRAQIWQRIYKQAFEEQQAALAEAHRRHQLDQKNTDHLLKAKALQQRIADAAAKRGKCPVINGLDDYLDLISFVRDQTVHLGIDGFWHWMAEQDAEFRETILAVMMDPAFALEEHQMMPRKDWRIWMKRMGRGAGKTYGASANTNLLAKYVYPGGYGILVGPTVKHVRDIMIDGPSGLLATAPADCVPVFRPHYNRVEWPNGTSATIYTADNPQGIRGPSLNFGWGDELTLWNSERTFDNLFRAVRQKHPAGTKLILTTSPIKAQEWVKAIESRANTVISTATSMANIHQDADHLAELEAEAAIGSTKAREEILGEWTTGESQLWSRENIETMALETNLLPKAYAETCSRRFLSVDPSGGVHDETGIILFGKKGKQAIALNDFSDFMGLDASYRRIIELAKEHLKPGDYVLFEDNNQKSGPALLRKMALEAGFSLRVVAVSAQKSKYARAEESFIHCQMGKVKLLHRSTKLEQQLVEWEPDMKNSPDRGDAFTQGVNHLLGTKPKQQFKVISLGRM